MSITFKKWKLLPVDVSPEGRALPIPKPGDRVVEIAGDNVRTEWIKVNGKLVSRKRSPLGSIVSTTANIRNEAVYPTTAIKSIADLDHVSTSVGASGRPTRRIQFEAPKDDPEHRGTFSRWFLVGDAPLSRSRLSIAWFAIESVVFWLGWLVFRRRPEDESGALFFSDVHRDGRCLHGMVHWQEIASNPALVFVFAGWRWRSRRSGLHFHLVTLSPRRLVQRYSRLTWIFLYGIPCLFNAHPLVDFSDVLHLPP